MEIIKVVVGLYQTNCYLVKNDKHVLIIDPGSKAENIISKIKEDEIIDAILLTHGHLDHIGAVDDIYNKYHCPIYVSYDDKDMLKDPNLNCSLGKRIVVNSPVLPITEGTLRINSFNVDVYQTSGHTQGSLVFKIENILFTGDTLFKGSVGRTDLPTGNNSELRKSLRLFYELDSSLLVYPGHEETSVLSYELLNNPYL